MTDKTPAPDFAESDALLEALFADVELWSSPLASGLTTSPTAETVKNLLDTRVTFGNPRANLIRLTKKRFDDVGVELGPITAEQLRKSHDFYYMTLTVQMRSRPGAVFKLLVTELDFGPKGPDEPIVQSIFPQNQWRDVLNFGGGLSLGLNGDLAWDVGVDPTALSAAAQLPGNVVASMSNKNDMQAFVVVPDFKFASGRFEIAAYGEGTSECFWRIDSPELQTQSTVQYGIVFKVPKGTQEVTLKGTAWAEPSMSVLTANLRDVLRDLSERFKALFRQKEDASTQLARGTIEEWRLELPQ